MLCGTALFIILISSQLGLWRRSFIFAYPGVIEFQVQKLKQSDNFDKWDGSFALTPHSEAVRLERPPQQRKAESQLDKIKEAQKRRRPDAERQTAVR